MPNILHPPPLTTPFAQQGGTPAPAWARWFSQFHATLSGFAVPNDWQAATLGAGWSNFGSGYEVAAYRKDAAGVVWVKGLVKSSGASVNPVFTLPAGFRPSEGVRRATSGSASGSGVDSFAALTVWTDGTVSVTPDTWDNIALGVSFQANQ